MASLLCVLQGGVPGVCVLLECLGLIAAHLVRGPAGRSGSFRHALPVLALQSCLYLCLVQAGAIKRHPGIFLLSLDGLLELWLRPKQACTYAICSAVNTSEYFGVTCSWHSRLYKHVRNAVVPGLANAQYVHAYVARFPQLFVYVPLCLGRRDLLETQLIRRYCPALNVHKQPHGGRPTPVRLAASGQQLHQRSRRHKPRGLVQQNTLVTYTCHGQEYLLLYDALLEQSKAGLACVGMRKGCQWLDSSKLLLSTFGAAVVYCPGVLSEPCPLKEVWQQLKVASVQQRLMLFLTEVRPSTTSYAGMRATLVGLLADRRRQRHLYQLSLPTLLSLYRVAEQFTPVRSRVQLCDLVASVVRGGHACNPAWSPCIRLPYGLHHAAGVVRALVRGVIPASDTRPGWQQYLMSRLRVVRGSGQSLAQLLHGHIKLACNVSQPALLSAVDDGRVLPVAALAGTVPECLRVITWHSGISPVNTWRNCVREVDSQLTQLAARFGGVAPSTRVVQAQLHRAYSGKHAGCTVRECIKARRWLDQRQLVLVPLDRDIYRSVLCSQSAYLSRLRQLFVEDTVHYQQAHMSLAAVLTTWHEQFQANQWSRFGRWDKQGSVGYAYWFPKAKNIAKSRVIVSCVHHPLKCVLGRAGRALIFLLARVVFQNFNMRTVQQLTQRLEAPRQWCADGDEVLLMVADIKEMYTGMLHSECVAAVQFIIDHCQQRLRSPYISVSTCRNGPVFVGKSKAAGMVVFPVADLLQLVQFELSNLYFTVGTDILLHQVIGAAMGGFTSPAAAQAVACVAEYRSMTVFVASGYLAASRFMDDTLVAINLAALGRSGQHSLGHVVHSLFSCYQPAGLQLELERAGATVAILQSIVSVAGGELHAYFWNKNAAYQRTGVQKVCRFIPTHQGGVVVAQQRSTVSSLVHRVAASTLDISVHLLLPVLQQLRCELQGMGYPGSIFDHSLRSYVHTQQQHSPFAAWHSLWRKVQALCSSGPFGG